MNTLHNIKPPSRRISLPDEALRKQGIWSIPQSLGAATLTLPVIQSSLRMPASNYLVGFHFPSFIV